MRKWTKAAGILFLAAGSVYPSQLVLARPGTPVTSGKGQTDVKVLEEVSGDPFANAKPTSQPTTAPAAVPVNSNADGTFSLNITNGADVVEQLRVIGFQSQKSIIPSKEVRGTLPAMDLYNVTVHEALDAILHSNGFAYREEGNFVYVYTAKEMAEMEKAARVTQTQVFHVYYTPAANAVTMIKPVLSPDAQVSVTTPAVSGLASGATDIGGNAHAIEDFIVVTDYSDNLEHVASLLKEIDRRPQQILIEATMLSATLNENNTMGVDFTVLGGVDFASLTGAGSSASGALSGNIINSTSNGAANIVDKGYAGGGTGFTQAVPAGGLRVGFVQNNIAVFLSALENVTDTTILANPKVLALNKQKGEVIVGRKDGYITTTVTDSSSVQTVEFLDTGTRLIFRPYIGDDGYIRMEIHPEVSSGGVVNGLPSKATTEVTSNVMIKDGHTIVIGGLFSESSSTSKSQVPFLGNLPFAGPLFRQQGDQTTRQEIIILLTPHIIKDDVAYSQASEEELKSAEKLRVGVRKGMMITGRERLAEYNYECAVAELQKAKPDRKKALWHLDAATGLNPKFREANDLKRDLTGKEITSVDNSTIRSFVSRQILSDRATPPSTTMPASVDIDPFPPAKDEQQVVKPQGTAQVKKPSTGRTQLTDLDGNVVTTKSVAAVPTKPANWGWSTLTRYTGKSFSRTFASVTRAASVIVARATSPATPAPTVAQQQPKATTPTVPAKTGAKTTVTELPSDEVFPGDKK